MITDLNRFIISVGQKLEKAEKEAASFDDQFGNPEYDSGYVAALKDALELARDIHNGRNGY